MGTLKNFEKKSHKAENGRGISVPRSFCFGLLVKKAHTHGFKHELSGLKSKHLTTRPQTVELCDLPREMRELSRGKKATTLSHNTCLSQV